ncbi:MAG TPA: bifunctional DNA-binding transcriptional regulator/O6-methylguanine-DNA methyltransferase Ada [Methylomirabilota bacterium]|nr:bifunctional DNA-binding transcriptional regulator/O6-methylguanine-DNA methyltransferase Ada [Methylomirabilota bacterium]
MERGREHTRQPKDGNADRYWRAVLARDPHWDGKFVLAVLSTRIYCRPSCPARRPLRRNVQFFARPEEAERSGFRACLRCRPREASSAVTLVQRAARELRANQGDGFHLGELARTLQTSSGILRRAFRQTTGLTPAAFADALRLGRLKKELRGARNIADAIYGTGFGSSSRVYERSNAKLGMTPASYRRGGEGMKIQYVVAGSDLGKVLVGATERGISAVYLGDSEKALSAELRREYPRSEITPAGRPFSKWVGEIVRRVEGVPARMDLPLDVQATAFQRRVWQELQSIPFGATRTYAQVARALGRPGAVRAVARACATNPVSVVVPCHRVVRKDGNLAGYRWGVSRKERLLARERGAAQA